MKAVHVKIIDYQTTIKVSFHGLKQAEANLF